MQQLRRPDRRGRDARRRRRGARGRRHVLRHRRHLRQPGRERGRCSAALLRGRRDEVVLATKFGKPMGDGAQRRGSRALHPCGARGIAASASRPTSSTSTSTTRRTPSTPLEETIGALEELVAEGKIRAYGTSNYRAETLERAKAIASDAYVSEQSEYSWLRRDVEADVLPTCERLGLGFIPYFPLASGLLTGKVSRDAPPRRGHAPARTDDRRGRPRPGRAAAGVGRGARRLAARRGGRRPRCGRRRSSR